jgi:hypothetical protein
MRWGSRVGGGWLKINRIFKKYPVFPEVRSRRAVPVSEPPEKTGRDYGSGYMVTLLKYF